MSKFALLKTAKKDSNSIYILLLVVFNNVQAYNTRNWFKTHQKEIEDGSVGQQRKENKTHASNHPRRDGCHPLRVWRDIGDGVKNISQHKEEGYKQSHATGYDFWWD